MRVNGEGRSLDTRSVDLEVSALPQVHINYVAVVVAALVPMILGAIWYAPGVFGNVWMRLAGKKPEEGQRGALPQAYAMMFIAALALAFVLAHVLQWANATTAIAGVKVSLTVWIGFVLATSAGAYIFEGRPGQLFWLNSGYYGIAIVIMGIILAVWK
jgi:hypothetical protein